MVNRPIFRDKPEARWKKRAVSWFVFFINSFLVLLGFSIIKDKEQQKKALAEIDNDFSGTETYSDNFQAGETEETRNILPSEEVGSQSGSSGSGSASAVASGKDGSAADSPMKKKNTKSSGPLKNPSSSSQTGNNASSQSSATSHQTKTS